MMDNPDKQIEGVVFVVKKPKDYYKITNEEIIIANNSHPDIVLVINKIRAIVTEVDSRLCHAAIISREYKKPLLMGIKDATREFKTGDIVRIDFENKSVYKIG